MESKPTCKDHKKALELFCKDCKELLCIGCLYTHGKKECKSPIDLLTYAELELLPIYKTQLEDLEEKKQTIEASIKDFTTSIESVKGELIQLKTKVEKLLAGINLNLDLLDANENKPFTTIDIMRGKIMDQYEEFKGEVKNENTTYIISKLNDKIQPVGIDDSAICLVEALNELLLHFTKSKELESLTESLQELNSRLRMFMDDSSADVKSNFVYGICEPQLAGKLLCKYDIQAKKLIATVKVPEHSSAVQIGKHVFVSGGHNPYVNTLYEFIEDSKLFVTKEPMKYPKYAHSAQAISNDVFVTIGGCNDSGALSYCEGYSITKNKWETLPSLNKARYDFGAAFLNKSLYAICGCNSNNSIEMLNMNEKKLWITLNLTCNELKPNCSTTAFPISKAEIMVFSGANKAGIFSIEFNAVKKCVFPLKSDSYCYNSVAVIKQRAYIIGINGHVHVYDMNTKSYNEVEYSATLS